MAPELHVCSMVQPHLHLLTRRDKDPQGDSFQASYKLVSDCVCQVCVRFAQKSSAKWFTRFAPSCAVMRTAQSQTIHSDAVKLFTTLKVCSHAAYGNTCRTRVRISISNSCANGLALCKKLVANAGAAILHLHAFAFRKHQTSSTHVKLIETNDMVDQDFFLIQYKQDLCI